MFLFVPQGSECSPTTDRTNRSGSQKRQTHFSPGEGIVKMQNLAALSDHAQGWKPCRLRFRSTYLNSTESLEGLYKQWMVHARKDSDLDDKIRDLAFRKI